jgi:eukaryotic-like serine/threonine-protein kinase
VFLRMMSSFAHCERASGCRARRTPSTCRGRATIGGLSLEPRATLGPYEISGAIGAGGMGEVYRARDTRLGREVAVKVLPGELTGDRERLLRFEREARSASALNHPNIVTIHEFAQAGDVWYLVMELVRGESLRDAISRGPLPLKKVLATAASVASGLAAAHADGIVHRDLKPENVMLTSDGTPKIVDFGLARNFVAAGDRSTQVQLSRDGAIVGTLAYMSPEQANGEEVHTQSDQFALGVIILEMATGSHPFRRRTAIQTLTAISDEPPPPLGDSFPEPLAWIIERCLAKDPAERYASTTDLARDLAALRDRASSLTPRPGTRPSTRRTALIATAAVAAAAALLAAGILLWPRAGVAGFADPIAAVVATPEVEASFNEVGVPVALAPNGRSVVVNGAGSRGTYDLWLHDLGSGAARLLAENASGAAWSPDSKAIAYFAEGQLKVMAAEGGPAIGICSARPEGTPTWSGDTILFVQYSGGPARAGIYRVSAGGGEPRRIVPAARESGRLVMPWWPQFLPDGNRFLYTTILPGGAHADHELMLGSLDSQERRRIAVIDSRAVFAAGKLLYVRDGTLLAHTFDLRKGVLTGAARPVTEGVHYFRSTGQAAFSVSDNGILAWRPARRPSRLVWFDRGGVEAATVATAVFDDEGRLTPDGSRYVVGVIDPKQGVSDVWVYGLGRESAERRTFQLRDERAPVWAYDGQTLYYRSDGLGGPPDIVELRAGGDTPALLHQGAGVEQPEDVSSDGKLLLFTSYSTSASDIYVLPLEPRGAPRPFATTPFNEISPRFSPGGGWVAYSSNLSGSPEVYVQRLDGGGATRISRDGGTRPRWRRDGMELFYLGPDGRVMSVPVNGGPDGGFGVPRVLFQAEGITSFEPAGDGNRFLAHFEQRASEPAVHLLLNWPGRLGANE